MFQKRRQDKRRIVVIGAGVGGLTAAAVLARAGMEVTVLEAHIYPGGCAGTFYFQGYRFDAGATLAGGFYPGGPMDLVAQAAGVPAWPARSAETTMAVHLPGSNPILLSSGASRWAQRRQAFGPGSFAFWNWQEQTADILWGLALRTLPWPPQSPAELLDLLSKSTRWIGQNKTNIHRFPELARDAVRPVAFHLIGAGEILRQFVDAQLLISAQTSSASANALYSASALDLPRRGVVHLEGGMGTIARTLAQALEQNGGRIHYRQEAVRIVFEHGQPVAVETRRGNSFPADIVIANLPPWNIARIMSYNAPKSLHEMTPLPGDGWGAFVIYVGLDQAAIPESTLHHQVVAREPLGEGNSVFLSLSPKWDAGRAPAGRRALTISTHTALAPWWQLFNHDREAYEARKAAYTSRILDTAQTIFPQLREAADLILPGTPVTFHRFTRREQGWVGGFPQTNLFRTWKPRLSSQVWMVGDSIFPGQSTAAVALGGLRVAESVLHTAGAHLTALACYQEEKLTAI